MNATTTATRTRGTAKVVASLRRALIAEANEAHASYPQYKGHFDGWFAAEVTRRTLVKGRAVAFEAGDVVLASPEQRSNDEGEVFTSCWSRRTGAVTSVPRADVLAVLIEDGQPRCDRCGHTVAGPEYTSADPDLPCPAKRHR